jgi:hypothetical protein
MQFEHTVRLWFRRWRCDGDKGEYVWKQKNEWDEDNIITTWFPLRAMSTDRVPLRRRSTTNTHQSIRIQRVKFRKLNQSSMLFV